jgi:hypothetical protein
MESATAKGLGAPVPPIGTTAIQGPGRFRLFVQVLSRLRMKAQEGALR